MAKIVKKSFPWFLVMSLVLGLVFSFSALRFNLKVSKVKADTASTSVEVGNVAPSFTIDPHEDPASWGGGSSGGEGPTNAGDAVTFKATATDANGDQWKLLVCKVNQVSGTDCYGGASNRWCQSNYVNSGNEASCSYTTSDSDAQSNDWWAFACDSQICSSASQGSGNSGSPFKVNHRPSFTAISNNSPKDPGENVTWTATVSDSDDDTYQDQVKLYVCATSGFDPSSGCSGTQLCASDWTTSNPSCSYSIPIPTPDTTYNAYVYVIDWHNFAASGSQQGANSSYTVDNVAPVVSNVTLNNGDNIDLIESSTKDVTVTATVSDNNSCQDIQTVKTSVYRSGIGWDGCNETNEQNDNYCYALITCTQISGTCTGSNDVDANYTCTVSIWYHADPTDSGTQYPDQNWKNTVIAYDEALSGNTEISTGVEMNSLVALDVTNSINYGTLAPGQANDTDRIATVTATGNVGLDVEYSGTDMTSGSNIIPVSQQKYDLTGGKTWDNMDYTLSTTPTERELNCQKTTNHSNPATKNTYFRIKIPEGQPTGTYSGTNTFGAVKGEPSEW
jgi:hypothetical protein